MPRAMVGHPNLICETLPDEAKKLGYTVETYPKRLWGDNEWNKVFCQVRAPKFKTTFEVQQMPGCCAVLIASYIDPNPYEHEPFMETIKLIEQAAYEAGFGSLMLSQVLLREQPANLKKHIWGLLPNYGWEMSSPFINAKSGNKVVYLTKNLGQAGKVNGLEIDL